MTLCACGNKLRWELHMNGTASCMNCGVLVKNEMFDSPCDNFMHSFQSMSVLCQTQTYTRAKRFKKYLHRACMRQSVNSVPDPTWKYLLDHRPYSGPPHILRTLKRAGRKLKNKCYDCLPLLVHHLCEVTVPVLSDREIATAMDLFAVIDAAFPQYGGFMSYAYALEFVLLKMGRRDMVPYLSGIQCVKRRAHYYEKLTRIFKDASVDGIPRVSGPKQSCSGSRAAPCASGRTAVLAQSRLPGGSICQQLLEARERCKSG